MTIDGSIHEVYMLGQKAAFREVCEFHRKNAAGYGRAAIEAREQGDEKLAEKCVWMGDIHNLSALQVEYMMEML